MTRRCLAATLGPPVVARHLLQRRASRQSRLAAVFSAVTLVAATLLIVVALPQPASAATVSVIAPGGKTTCAIKTGGNAYCWGDNTYGQIGDNSTTARTAPTLVSGGYTWSSISTQYDDADSQAETCGVTTTGVGYCWGSNTYGQLGFGNNTSYSVPKLVSGGYTWKSITVGYVNACGITSTDIGYCWGGSFNGQIGDSFTTDRNVPTAFSGAFATYTWLQLSIGNNTTCGVRLTTGIGYCWGWNNKGQIGDNTTADKHIPTLFSGAFASYTWSSISTGNPETCGVRTSGVGYCWGRNDTGQLGDNTTADKHIPTLFSGAFASYT